MQYSSRNLTASLHAALSSTAGITSILVAHPRFCQGLKRFQSQTFTSLTASDTLYRLTELPPKRPNCIPQLLPILGHGHQYSPLTLEPVEYDGRRWLSVRGAEMLELVGDGPVWAWLMMAIVSLLRGWGRRFNRQDA